MLANWLNSYRFLMYKTRLLSRIGAFLMSVLAISEGIIVIQGVRAVENLGPEAVIGASIPVVTYFVVFTVRFCLLYKYPLATAANVATWWAGAAAVYACAEPNPHFYYFRIESAGLFFVFFSVLRFLVTAVAAFSKPNEFNSNRR